MEHTFVLIKPDGVQLGLAGQIISKLDKEGFTLKGLKMITLDRTFAEKHYQPLSANPYFSRFVNYLISGPVVAMIWDGENVVLRARKIIQETIRPDSDLERVIGSNLVHGSDSLESAIKEIALWFPDGPVKLHSDAAKPKAREIGRISVTGFDFDRPRKHLKSVLREHYNSCGKITDVYVDKKSRRAIIYLVGEDAVDKALNLNGCEVGGWKLCAQANPFRDDNPVSVTVEGYATSLSEEDLESELRVLFSSCGTVVSVRKLTSCAVVSIRGFDAAEKALELGGSTIGRRKVLVKEHTEPPRYTVHDRRVHITRRQRFAVHDRPGRVQK